jgi:hypothetical protein
MSERTDYPAGVPCWVDAFQPEPDAALRFYGGLFGWEELGRRYGVEHVGSYPDFERLVKEASAAAVYVALPNQLHREWTERDAGAGRSTVKTIVGQRLIPGLLDRCLGRTGYHALRDRA